MRRIALLALGMLFWSSSALAMDATLAWDANSETDLAGYKIYYDEDGVPPFGGTGASNGASPQVVPLSSITPSSPQWTVRGLDALKKYYFAATAYDSEVPSLESGYSNIVFVGPIQYILTTAVVGTGGTIAPSTGAYAVATQVALTAAPGVGYRVRAWVGTSNDTLKTNSNLVTMTGAKTVTVSFELIPTAPATPTNMRVVSVQ